MFNMDVMRLDIKNLLDFMPEENITKKGSGWPVVFILLLIGQEVEMLNASIVNFREKGVLLVLLFRGMQR